MGKDVVAVRSRPTYATEGGLELDGQCVHLFGGGAAMRRPVDSSMGLDRPVAKARTHPQTHLVHDQLVSGAPSPSLWASSGRSRDAHDVRHVDVEPWERAKVEG
jgi:hypothetical protein